MLEDRNIIEYETEAEWLELRKQCYTSTMTAALFGMGKYLSKFALYIAKSKGLEVPFEENERMGKGKRLEWAVAEEVGLMLGMEVRPFKSFVTIPDTKIGSSFDYQIKHPVHGWIILEIKCVDAFIYKEKWLQGEAPSHIEVQVQHQMEVANCDHAIIAAAVGMYEIHIHERERDREFGQLIRQQVEQFESDIENAVEPEPDFENDGKILSLLYKGAEGTLDATKEPLFELMVMDFEEAKKKEKEIGIQIDVLKNKIHHYLECNSHAYTNKYKVNASYTKDSLGTLITSDMVGNYIGGKKGYRQLRITDLTKAK